MDGTSRNDARYEDDFFAWTASQASRLRAGDVSALDLDHLAEEIESLGASERREVASRLARLMQHLLKWHYQSERRSRSWAATIWVQRDELAAVLDDSPSLRGFVEEVFVRSYARARHLALEEIGLYDLPAEPPWNAAQVLSPEFLPG